MDFKTIAEAMYPYWILGTIVIGLVIAAGQKNLLRFELKPILKWMAFLVGITAWRYAMVKMLGTETLGDPNAGANMLPWTASLTVFWEDACHGLPLLVLRNLIGTKKWWAKAINYPLLLLTMFEFGAGHLYQGLFASILLSMYVPYSIRCGKKYGFGTVILCHMLYDATTMLFIKFMFGM